MLRPLLREPALHFFIVGAMLFVAHRVVMGEPRTIVVTPGLKADLARRFLDDNGRTPTVDEAEKALSNWKRGEALYREALREGLDRNDGAIRTILIDKVHARAIVEAPKRQPTEADLTEWLNAHRGLYEKPRRYALEWVTVDPARQNATDELAKLADKLNAGADSRVIGRPIFGANLTEAEIQERFGASLAASVAALPTGRWQDASSAGALQVMRVNGAEGGLPPPDELRPRLLVDWTAAQQAQEASRAIDDMVAKYRFEEQR